MKKFFLLLLVVAAFVMFGCAEKGRMERAGERGDEIVDNIKEGDNPLKKKGTMEKMGEAIDETFDRDNN